MIESFNKSIPFFPKNINNIEDPLFWRTVLENDIGSRNASYILNNIYENIITPIEVSILKSRGYPTDIKNILKFICEEIVKGRVDDWNSTNNLRIRTSELFVALLQKLIYASYNEYNAKLLGGDEDATIFINPTKVLSQIINSQNVNQLENINALEELAMMTRITPVGIGGVKTPDAWPKQAMNIHPTYFGNIDPLETPNSNLIGIQQHLALGANITNMRGLFAERDRSKIKSSDVLSVGPALIPFVESNDGARVTMASVQAKQAIPLKTPENPAIQTGYESIFTDFLSDSFIKRSPIDGQITEITDLQIVIKGTKTNVIKVVNIEPVELKSGQGKSGLGVFKPVVKVGQKVKEKQIIAEGANIKDGIISNGINASVAFMPWEGYNFEDGMVISESLAKKFTSLHLEKQQVYVLEDEDVSNISSIGSVVTKGESLLSHSTTVYDTDTLQHLRAEGGIIVNIEVYSNIPEDQIPEKLLPVYKEFRTRYEKEHGNYPIEHFKERGEKFNGILVIFTIQQELECKKGNKLNNRAFNKGIISLVEKDENMPIIVETGQRIDMIYSTLSVINRMNPGQLLELHTSTIARKLAELIESKTRNQFIEIFSSVIKLLDGTDGQIYSKASIAKLKSMNDNTYNKLKQQIIESRFYPLIFPPFKTPERDKIFQAMKLIGVKTKYKLKLPKYDIVTSPVACGYIYVSVLEHMISKKIHSRSVAGYKQGSLMPTAGKKRGGGSMLGEYDLYSLLAWDSSVVVDELIGPQSSDHVSKGELISQIVNTGDANFQPTVTNPVKNIFSSMMKSIHLEAE